MIRTASPAAFVAKDWKEIIENPDKPMLNRAIQSRLAPGSTFKPIMAIAGLEEGVITPDFRSPLQRRREFLRPLLQMPQEGRARHGGSDTRRSRGSCDVFFYTVGNKLGIDKIAQVRRDGRVWAGRPASTFRTNQTVWFPRRSWKMRTFRQKWYAGETISVAIGQGALEVSPLQLAHAIGGIATGGVWQKPHLVLEKRSSGSARKADLNIENVMKVINGMQAVVNGGGTGGRARIPGTGCLRQDRNVAAGIERCAQGHRVGQDDEGQRVVRRLCSQAESGDRGGGAVRSRRARRYGGAARA